MASSSRRLRLPWAPTLDSVRRGRARSSGAFGASADTSKLAHCGCRMRPAGESKDAPHLVLHIHLIPAHDPPAWTDMHIRQDVLSRTLERPEEIDRHGYHDSARQCDLDGAGFR